MNSIRRPVAEGIGTFFLVLIGPGAVMVDAHTGGVVGNTGIALAFGFVVFGVVGSIGPISGAHINPAVTIALWRSGLFPTGWVIPYVIAQCIGASLASLVLLWILGPVADLGATVPRIPIGRAFVVELLLSFALMFVIMSVATARRNDVGLAGLMIGLTVAFDAIVGGPLTGASMNPARSFGPALVGGFWTGQWIYWVAPITAMIAAAKMHGLLRAPSASEVLADVPMGARGAAE